ncbi:MAG: energy transducer TonB [Nitrospira sp.]|nr:energy transducer TonB [Nitrospira sp.]
MTAAGPQHFESQKSSHVQGWVVSLLLHGAVVLGTVLLVKEIQLGPQEKPFKWDALLVSPTELVTRDSSPPSQAQAQPAPQTQSPQTTPSITEQTVTPVAPKTPVPPPPQPAQPIKHETAAPVVTNAPAVENPSEAPVAAPAKPTAQTPPPRPPALLEPTAKPDAVPAQTAGIAPAPANEPAKRDYGWLAEAIIRRVEELKRYPAAARIERAEGRVMVKIVLSEDGSVGEIEVVQSSGFPSLDKAAIETIRQAAPFHLPHPLGRPQLTIKIPISYRLDS